MTYSKDLDLEQRWVQLKIKIGELIGKRPKDLNSVLFLIGVRELGNGVNSFSKEEKQDLMHIGICKVLSLSNYYRLEGLDGDGWPIWINVNPLPKFNLSEQESLLKMHVIEYFEKEEIV